MKSIQAISGARWLAEFYTISELEIYDSLSYDDAQQYAKAFNYDMTGKSSSFGYVMLISLIFHVIAYLGLKLKDRRLKK